MDFEMWVALIGLAVALPTGFFVARLRQERRQAKESLAEIERWLARRAELMRAGRNSDELATVEAELDFVLHSHNELVAEYMAHLESFPDGLIARLFGFRDLPYFEESPKSR